jgi:hypothetical protein
MADSVETIKDGCPICSGDVKGDDRHLFFCANCGLLYKREHLQLSKSTIEKKIKSKIVERYSRTSKEKLALDLEKRDVKKKLKKN